LNAKERIVQAAAVLFNEQGTGKVSTNHIAAAAHMSPGTPRLFNQPGVSESPSLCGRGAFGRLESDSFAFSVSLSGLSENEMPTFRGFDTMDLSIRKGGKATVDQELKVILESIQGELKSVKENQVTFAKEVNQRFDGIDSRFDAVDARFDAVDARFDAVDARFDAVDARFGGIDNRLDEVDGKLVTITNQLNRLEGETNDNVIALLQTINGKLETLATKEDVEYLAGRVGRTELEIDRLKRAK